MAKRKYKKRKSAKRSWQGLYESYKEQYAKEARKHEMYDPEYSMVSFQTMYVALKNDMIAEGQKPNNIIRSLVSRQSFEISGSQARAILKAYEKELGRDTIKAEGITMRKIRQFGKKILPDTFWAVVSDEYYRFIKEGYSAKEAKMLVSQSVFGSK
nr:MAG TPA: hypothetical protein [Bacteriophage sp.]